MADIMMPIMPYKEIGEKGANYALDEFEYNGLTIRQWADKITSGDYAPVVHGRWVNGCQCSVCGDRHGPYNSRHVQYYNHCPNCGAKMDEEENYDD